MPDEAGQRHQDLTEQEQRLLDLIRDGRVDAEIAVRLGISNVEAKERIEQLGWETSCTRPRGVARWKR